MNLTGVARIGAAQVVLLLFLSLISSCQGGTPVTLQMSWTLGNTHLRSEFRISSIQMCQPSLELLMQDGF
jgi:hypothetical protein